MDTENTRVNIYQLEDPDLWVQNETLILATLLKAFRNRSVNVKAPTFDFRINPICGWIYFHDGSKMDTLRQKTNLILEESGIRRVADQVITDIIALSREEDFLKRNLPPLLPGGIGAKIIFKSAQLVPHSDLPFMDHWLVRYGIYLKHGAGARGEFIPVLGADISLRLVSENEIIGFHSTWRPSFLESEEDNQVTQPPATEGTTDDPDEKKTIIMYDSNGENCMQNFMLPYYVNLNDHNYTLQPASEKAFHIDCTEFYDAEDNKNVEITIIGGSGKFDYVVFGWYPNKIWDEGMAALNSGSYTGKPISFVLESAAQNLIIWAIDIQTGIIRKQEQMFFPFPKIKDNIPLV